MNDDTYTIKSGFLDVGDGHKIYYQRWGNPNATPIFVFHGGPGSSSKPHHKLAFNPKRNHVIFHDQRGCGQSTYKDQFSGLTSQALVNDAELLRRHFGFKKIHVFGHSWGSTVGSLYALSHPERVDKMLLGGIYTGSRAETAHLYKGGLASYFPEAWDRFIENVPVSKREDIFNWYEKAITTGENKERLDNYKRWSQLESSAMSIDSDYKKNWQAIDSAEDIIDLEIQLKLDLLGIHYFKNNCFLPERYILKNVHKLAGKPIVVLQGRYDTVCKPDIAYEFAKNIGESCHLHIVPAAHKPEGALREVQRAYAWSLLI